MFGHDGKIMVTLGIILDGRFNMLGYIKGNSCRAVPYDA
jgi:hypothetical protein